MSCKKLYLAQGPLHQSLSFLVTAVTVMNMLHLLKVICPAQVC